ncbi:MAG: glycosyl hydrolase [Burkholderiales bacterium]|nr:glycosyl hydrolase [Burkholderiales bacterium]
MSLARRPLLRAAGGAAFAALAGAAGSVAAGATPPAVLQRPALRTPLAPGAAMLALARAGRRLVAAGERGIVLTSDDEGRSWTQAQVPVQVSLTALRFADDRHGWAAGHLGVLLATADAGASWTLKLDGVRAAQLTLDAAPDDAARKHAQRLVEDGPDKPFFDLEIGSAGALVVGAYGLALESRDGKRFTSFAPRLPNPKRLHLYGARAAGERLLIVGEQGLMLRSLDGGAGFEALASPYKGSFFGLLSARSGTLLAYGLRGNVLRSTDFGGRWAAVNTGVPVGISAAVERDDGALVLLAQTGDLFTSRDDGLHFERRPAAPPFPATALAPAGKGALVLAGLRGLRRVEAA